MPNKSPKGYISPTQLLLWEKSPSLYYWRYIEGQEMYNNKYMRLGKRLAEARERGSDKDPTIDFLATFMPSYPKKEYDIRVNFEGIPLLGKLDGFNPWTKTIGEDKTGKQFTQSMADKLDQLTFYALLVWVKYKKIPNIALHWAKTKEEDGYLFLTGEFKTFETKRTLKDFILLSKRIKIAWAGICELNK